MTAAVTSGCFSDFKLIRGRKVAQIVVEIPIEQADAALRALGGLPNPADERWVAIARLDVKAPPEEPKQIEAPRKKWEELAPSQQAAIRCNDPAFWDFLSYEYGGDVDGDETAKYIVRDVCGVQSRAQLNEPGQAMDAWKRMEDQFYKYKAGMR